MFLFVLIVCAMLVTGVGTYLFHMVPIWWEKLIDAMAKTQVDEHFWDRGRGQWF